MVLSRLIKLNHSLVLAGLLGGGLLIALVVLSALSISEGRSNAEQSADHAALNIVSSLQQEVARNFEVLDLSLQGTIAASQEPALANLTGLARQFFLFDSALKAKYVNSIILLNDAGNVVGDSLSLVPRSGNFTDRDYFQAHQDRADVGLFVSRPFRSRLANQQWVIAISRRIDGRDGKFAGVAVGVVQIAYFESLVQHLSLGTSGSVSLVRRDGVLISRRPALYESGSDFSHSNLFAHYPAERSGRFDAIATSDGAMRRFTFAEVPGLPIVVAVGLSVADIYSAWSREALRILMLTVVMIGAMAALLVLLVRQLRRRKRLDALLHESEARYRLLADHSSDAIILRDAQAVRTYASPAFYEMVGRLPDDLGSRSIRDFLDEDARHSTHLTFERVRGGESPVVSGFYYDRPDGRRMWLEAISNGIFDDQGNLQEVVTNLRDATERKRAENELVAAAITDGLTGLGNRRAFEKHMAREWKRAIRGASEICVLMIDADLFKSYNDTFGHLAGDEALKCVGTAINTTLRRPADFGARYGGEEFVAILPETNVMGGLVVAETIRTAVARLTSAEGSPRRLTVSIGLATLRPGVGDLWHDLVSQADAALYLAKKLGRDRCIVSPTQASSRLTA